MSSAECQPYCSGLSVTHLDLYYFYGFPSPDEQIDVVDFLTHAQGCPHGNDSYFPQRK